MRKRSPETRIVVCLLYQLAQQERGTIEPREFEMDAVVNGIEHAGQLIDNWIARHPTEEMLAAPLPANEVERLRALHRLGLTSSSGRGFDEVAKHVSLAFDAPIALVTVVSEDHQLWPGAAGLPSGLEACRMSDRETSICGHVVAMNDVLVIEDVAEDIRFANNSFLLEHGIRFYAGAPLRTLDGYPIGSLCIIDFKPRTFSDDEKEKLLKIAKSVMINVEMSLFKAIGY